MSIEHSFIGTNLNDTSKPFSRERVRYYYIGTDDKESEHFPTYEQARQAAEEDFPEYRPYNIIKSVEHLEVFDIVGRDLTWKN